jgi:hypothetical protein
MSFAALRAQRDARHAPLRRAGLAAPTSEAAPTHSTGAGSGEPRESSTAEPSTAPTEHQDVDMAEREEPAADPADAALFPELADTALEVRRSPRHGRGLYARKEVARGTSAAGSV